MSTWVVLCARLTFMFDRCSRVDPYTARKAFQKLERARRVIPILRKIDQCNTDLASPGSDPSVPAHIRKISDTAVRAHEDAHRNIETAMRDEPRSTH